jgi:5'-3' exonuclease
MRAQFADVLALMGDASDNIPGVAGIGKKIAVALLQEFGDLDTLLASAEQVTIFFATCCCLAMCFRSRERIAWMGRCRNHSNHLARSQSVILRRPVSAVICYAPALHNMKTPML